MAGPYDLKIALSLQEKGSTQVKIRFRNTNPNRHSKPCTILLRERETGRVVKSFKVPALKPNPHDGTRTNWSPVYKFNCRQTQRLYFKIKENGVSLGSRKFRGPEDL